MLALLLVIVWGWFFGVRGGLLIAVLAFPLNSLLVVLAGDRSWHTWIYEGGGLGSVGLLMVAPAVGLLSDLRERLRRALVENVERKRAEERIHQQNEFLNHILVPTINIRR